MISDSVLVYAVSGTAWKEATLGCVHVQVVSACVWMEVVSGILVVQGIYIYCFGGGGIGLSSDRSGIRQVIAGWRQYRLVVGRGSISLRSHGNSIGY